jgi:hypothetical protein
MVKLISQFCNVTVNVILLGLGFLTIKKTLENIQMPSLTKAPITFTVRLKNLIN